VQKGEKGAKGSEVVKKVQKGATETASIEFSTCLFCWIVSFILFSDTKKLRCST